MCNQVLGHQNTCLGKSLYYEVLKTPPPLFMHISKWALVVEGIEQFDNHRISMGNKVLYSSPDDL